MKEHPTAIIHPQAELADDTEVQAFSIIGPNVTIGEGTVIGPHCVIEGQTTIGKNNRFYSGVQVGIVAQDLKHNPKLTGRTQIGDKNVLREHVTVSASTMETYDDDHRITSLADGCMLMAYSHVAHDCHVGSRVILANCASLAGHVEVEDHAILGGLCGVHQECSVGSMAFIGALTRVAKDVPPYMIVEGNPARCCGPNTVGLKRNNVSPETRAYIKSMYRIMCRLCLNTTQALQEIEDTVAPRPERDHFVEFVRKSLRGVTK